jgi:hypothetical protein
MMATQMANVIPNMIAQIQQNMQPPVVQQPPPGDGQPAHDNAPATLTKPSLLLTHQLLMEPKVQLHSCNGLRVLRTHLPILNVPKISRLASV